MSYNPSAEERKIAVLVAAMQDMHGETEEMLKKMQAAVRATSAASAGIAQAGAAVVPAVAHATTQAVEVGMQRAIAEMAAPARGALEDALKPALEQFAGLVQRAAWLEKTAQRSMRWFSYKWIVLIGAGFVGMSAMAWASVWWQRDQVNELTAQRTALEADITEMQTHASELAKKGSRIKFADCGGRLCIVASKNQTGSFSDWHGLWNNASTGETMVIPNGY